MKKLLAALLVALLAGCATPTIPTTPTTPTTPTRPDIDRTYSATGQSSRVKFLIIHYTVSDLSQSLKGLTQTVVSSHYLLTDEPRPVVYGLVDESRQANHAGVSNWKNYTLLNGSSVGIEIVNPGYIDGPAGRVFQPFPQAQIDRLIVLVKEIVARHQIPPENILGHSDIAPQRKQDPGPMFPWHQLAQHKLVLWPDATRLAAVRPMYAQQLPDVTWFQQKLSAHGYAVPQTGVLDEATRNVVAAFQMKYRPTVYDGNPDAETAALLEVLTNSKAGLPPAPAPVAVPIPVPAPPVAVPAAVPVTTPMPASPPVAAPAPAPKA